jgi:hypothetical protein
LEEGGVLKEGWVLCQREWLLQVGLMEVKQGPLGGRGRGRDFHHLIKEEWVRVGERGWWL